jgi:hypothetical protein
MVARERVNGVVMNFTVSAARHGLSRSRESARQKVERRGRSKKTNKSNLTCYNTLVALFTPKN